MKTINKIQSYTEYTDAITELGNLIEVSDNTDYMSNKELDRIDELSFMIDEYERSLERHDISNEEDNTEC